MNNYIPKNIGILLVSLSLMFSTIKAQAETVSNSVDQNTWISSMLHSVEFFNQHAWDEANGTYFSEISAAGELKSEAIHLIALSRMIYALSYASIHDPVQLERAESAAQYLLANMTQSDSKGPYFIGTIDTEGNPVQQNHLVVNEQAYGLNGLIALYDVTKDQTLLATIDSLYQSFLRRFKDTSDQGGFFDLYNVATETANHTKSYNSTVYVATSFLMEYARITGSESATFITQELANIVASNFLDVESGWIYENFRADWQPWIKVVAELSTDEALIFINEQIPEAANQRWQFQKIDENLRSIGVVGHNFQAAWFLMRAALDPKTSPQQQAKWTDAARTILYSLLNSEAIDRDRGGVYDVFQRETGEHMWHTNKAWWQQAEAIMTLELAITSGLYASEDAVISRNQAASFYVDHFIDWQNGGEFAEVTDDGLPVTENGVTKDKGHRGKSAYHAVELARFMLIYSENPPAQ